MRLFWLQWQEVLVVLPEGVLDQNGPNDHFGQNALIPSPFWPDEVHLGPPTVVWSLLSTNK